MPASFMGELLGTMILILLLTWLVGRTTLFRAAILGVLATLFCYVVFGIWLGVRLP